MKKVIFFILLAPAIMQGFAQNHSDSVAVTPKYFFGTDVLGLGTSFFNTSGNLSFSLKFFKDVEKRVYRFSANYRHLANRRYDMYTYLDADSNLVTRDYYINYDKVDLRAGSGIKNKLGSGEMILGIDLIFSYSEITDNLIEYKVAATDSLHYGNDSTSTVSQVFSLPGASYIGGGLDISISYQIPLGNRFFLNVEYAPEVNFNYLLEKENSLHTSDYKYNDYYLDAYFNRFYFNLIYKF